MQKRNSASFRPYFIHLIEWKDIFTYVPGKRSKGSFALAKRLQTSATLYVVHLSIRNVENMLCPSILVGHFPLRVKLNEFWWGREKVKVELLAATVVLNRKCFHKQFHKTLSIQKTLHIFSAYAKSFGYILPIGRLSCLHQTSSLSKIRELVWRKIRYIKSVLKNVG